ncbi:hypothetical protein PIB30_027888 [Stylosanthes scabra]|uniref:Uncharacterized protein n=1 Tax=Stylosanthes scabra TaxID=79078 RepID=A0ABU6XAX7_9FABA|nr:hypothetical protein [Stylosanthes scabra]
MSSSSIAEPIVDDAVEHGNNARISGDCPSVDYAEELGFDTSIEGDDFTKLILQKPMESSTGKRTWKGFVWKMY